MISNIFINMEVISKKSTIRIKGLFGVDPWKTAEAVNLVLLSHQMNLELFHHICLLYISKHDTYTIRDDSVDFVSSNFWQDLGKLNLFVNSFRQNKSLFHHFVSPLRFWRTFVSAKYFVRGPPAKDLNDPAPYSMRVIVELICSMRTHTYLSPPSSSR